MKREKVKSGPLPQAPSGVVADKSLKDVAFEFNQIFLKNKEEAKFAGLSRSELADMAFEHEMIAAKARYLCWKKQEADNAK